MWPTAVSILISRVLVALQQVMQSSRQAKISLRRLMSLNVNKRIFELTQEAMLDLHERGVKTICYHILNRRVCSYIFVSHRALQRQHGCLASHGHVCTNISRPGQGLGVLFPTAGLLASPNSTTKLYEMHMQLSTFR
jgi:hypothetical protein